jgi:hypothetical protein
MPVKNICPCDNPPGGSVECEPNQMAICSVQNGVATRQCLNPVGPEAIELVNWAISKITGQIRNGDTDISMVELVMLLGKRYKSPRGVVVNFTLPEKVTAAVTQIFSEIPKPQIRQTFDQGQQFGQASAGA